MTACPNPHCRDGEGVTLPGDAAFHLRAALAGFDAQYGETPLGAQRPELPSGHVQRVESVVAAARLALAELQQFRTSAFGKEAVTLLTPWPATTGCFICDHYRALWNATGLGKEPERCSKHRETPPLRQERQA